METGRATVLRTARLHRTESGPNPNVNPPPPTRLPLHRTNNKLRPIAPNLRPYGVSALDCSKAVGILF